MNCLPGEEGEVAAAGAEKYVGDIYAHGDISLREAAEVLDLPLREALEFFWDMGISGNVDADKAFKAISLAEKKSSKTRSL